MQKTFRNGISVGEWLQNANTKAEKSNKTENGAGYLYLPFLFALINSSTILKPSLRADKKVGVAIPKL